MRAEERNEMIDEVEEYYEKMEGNDAVAMARSWPLGSQLPRVHESLASLYSTQL
jgi:hypothetical protein